jgi:hypothetical protein
MFSQQAMPKYLVEITLIVKAKNPNEAQKIADYIVNVPISDSKIENKIESLRYEEIVQIPNHKPQ